MRQPVLRPHYPVAGIRGYRGRPSRARYLSLASSAGSVTSSVARSTWIPEVVVGRWCSSLCKNAHESLLFGVFFFFILTFLVRLTSIEYIHFIVCFACLRVRGVCHVIVVVPFSENRFCTPKSSSPVTTRRRLDKMKRRPVSSAMMTHPIVSRLISLVKTDKPEVEAIAVRWPTGGYRTKEVMEVLLGHGLPPVSPLFAIRSPPPPTNP